ncbi:unnamed protein product [Citrullus colocynthis]|uniref:DUF4283 domain-containing protein n=1 Tax=Citrullus colocynthis TaxID=252529 RepID=A0ABP0XS74_9ROSI
MAEPKGLLEDWRKLHLTEEENDVQIDYDSQMDNIISRQMKYCLIDKLLSSRRIVPRIIKNTFANAWRTNLGFNVEGLGRNLFLVKFDTKKDKEMPLAFWIKLLDIPLGLHNKYMAKKILIDITKPLRRGIWIKSREDQERMWINIRVGDSDAEVDPRKWQFDGWLRFKGNNIRRRKNSPQRNEKESSFAEFPASKGRNSPSVDNLGLSMKEKVSKGSSPMDGNINKQKNSLLFHAYGLESWPY